MLAVDLQHGRLVSSCRSTMDKEAWQAMPVRIIPSTVNSQTCTQEALGGKDGLEAHLEPKGAGSFSRSYIPAAFSRMSGAVAGVPGCVCASAWMCIYVAPEQQKTHLGSDSMALLSVNCLPEFWAQKLCLECSQGPGSVCWGRGSGLPWLSWGTALLLARSDGFLDWQGCWINFILPAAKEQSYYLEPTLATWGLWGLSSTQGTAEVWFEGGGSGKGFRIWA